MTAPCAFPKWDGTQWVVDIKAVVTDKGTVIDSKREELVAKGVPWIFPDGKSGTVQIRNMVDVRNILTNVVGALILYVTGKNDPVLMFRDQEDVTHTGITPQQMLEMGLAIFEKGQAIYSTSWNLKGIIDDLAKDPTKAAEIAAYPIADEWPK